MGINRGYEFGSDRTLVSGFAAVPSWTYDPYDPYNRGRDWFAVPLSQAHGAAPIKITLDEAQYLSDLARSDKRLASILNKLRDVLSVELDFTQRDE